jgi:hypothetical protein
VNPYLGTTTASPVVFDFIKGTVDPPAVRLVADPVVSWPQVMPRRPSERHTAPRAVPVPVLLWASVLFVGALIGTGIGLIIVRRWR